LSFLPEVQEQVDALPKEALASYTEVLVMLEVTPWSGDPYSREHPDGSTRAESLCLMDRISSCYIGHQFQILSPTSPPATTKSLNGQRH
jgi:hypothetical protein